jgi:aldose sugar dehydrogenase
VWHHAGPARGRRAQGAKLLLIRAASDGAVTEVGRLPQLDGKYGGLRAVRPGNNGALYVTTSSDDDK